MIKSPEERADFGLPEQRCKEGLRWPLDIEAGHTRPVSRPLPFAVTAFSVAVASRLSRSSRIDARFGLRSADVRDHTALSRDELAFLEERHLATLTTLRPDGSPHVVAIAFAYHPQEGVVRIISPDNTQKVRNIERTGRAAVCQVDGPRWLTLEGPAVVQRDAADIATAVASFEARYRPPRQNPTRVAICIDVDRVLGRA